MTQRTNLTGQRFGRLTVLTLDGGSGSRWLCECDCGNSRTVLASSLVGGRTQSCGCLRAQKAGAHLVKHGLSGTITHKSWTQMRRRCTDPNHANYKWYGGRGISFDPRWKDFLVFLDEMGECPDRDHTLDRIDPNKDYTKDNCEWRPLKDSVRRNTPIVQGMSLKAYAEANSLKYHTAYARWKAGTLV